MPAIPQTRLIDDLRGAAERGELVASYQPQVRISDRRVVGVEALARWNHPEFGLITPSDFIPVAESTGLITSIGHHMLEIALEQVAVWRSIGLQLDIAVNVSPTQLVTDTYCADVEKALERFRVPARGLIIEITESEPIVDLPAVVDCLKHIRDLGAEVSIDDFGVGHSSIEQFRNLPLSELKIDQSIIRGPVDEAIDVLMEVLEEARERGLRVVAEGVETEAHFELAERLRCDRAQGFMLGRPMSADALEAALT